MNYQKELDKLVQKLSDDGRVPSSFFIVVVRLAAVMCWNILVIILRLRYYIIIRTFFQKVNIRRESGNSRS